MHSRRWGLRGRGRAAAAGQLVILNRATGALVQTIGPLNYAAATNYLITDLAFHPTTGAVSGSTGNNPNTTGARLVSTNPATAQVTVIGSFNAGPVNANGVPATMADLAFDAAGNLYCVGSIGGPQQYSINTATGQATGVGSTGLASTTGGGANGALDFDNATLYGPNVGPGSPPPHLATIDGVGDVTPLGAAPASIDAIAFQIPEPSGLALIAVAFGLLGIRRR